MTGTRYGLEIWYRCGKRVNTNSQKVFGANSHVCISYRGKTNRGAFLLLILNRVMMRNKFRSSLQISEILFVSTVKISNALCWSIPKETKVKVFSVCSHVASYISYHILENFLSRIFSQGFSPKNLWCKISNGYKLIRSQTSCAYY